MSTQSSPPPGIAFDVLRLEYERLKTEQAQRIQFRDNLLMAHLTVVGAVIGFIVSNSKNPLIVYAYLVLPWTSSVLGWAYLNNDIIISNIRDYIIGDMLNAAARWTGTRDLFGWETHIGRHRLRAVRKIVQMLMDLATFVMPSIASLCLVLSTKGWKEHSWPYFLLYGIDWLITILLLGAVAVWSRYDISPQASNTPITWSSSESEIARSR